MKTYKSLQEEIRGIITEMRYPKGHNTPLPKNLEAEMARLTDLLSKIDRRFSSRPEPVPDPAMVDEYNAAVKKFNAAVRPISTSKEMISLGYDGKRKSATR